MKLSKVLSLVLAIAMLLSVPTFAAFTDVAADASYAEAVTVLSALEIINGYGDGTFKPDGKITRAEYAAIVCRIIGMEDAAKGGVSSFTDVAADHWATGYIATAQNAGIVNGKTATTFGPEDEVTYEQAVKMLVVALGYELKAQSMGGYPTGYMMIANQESITVGTTNTAGGASRATVARLTYNALTVPMMDQTSWGSEAKFEPIATQSLLYTKLNAVKAEVTFSAVPLNKEETNVALTYTAADCDSVTKANVAKGNIALQPNVKINGVDLAGLQGLTATAIIDKTDDAEFKLVCVVPKSGKNIEITIDPAMLDDANTSDGYVEYYKTNDDDKASKIKVPTGGFANTYTNLVAGGAITEGGASGDIAYRFVDTDNDGTYETVFIDKVAIFVVGSVSPSANKIYRDSASTALATAGAPANITLDPEDDTTSWSITDTDGNVLELADVKAGDVLAVATSIDTPYTYYDIVVSNETIEGDITETFAENAKVVGMYGTALNKFKVGDADYMLLNNAANQIVAGDSIVAKVFGDKVVSYEVAEGVKNYGMIIDTHRAEDFGVTYQLQILTQKGELVTLDLAEKVNGVTATYADNAALAAAFPKGDIIAYSLNNAGEVKAHDVETGYVATGLTENRDVLKDGDKFTSGSVYYKATSEKLGAHLITEDTIIFTTETLQFAITKSNVSLAAADILDEDIPYNAHVLYDDNREAKVVVLVQAANQVSMDAYPLVVTKVATVNVEGDSRTKYFGLENGEEVEYVVADNADASATLAVGDIAMISVNANGEIKKAIKLVEKTGAGFVVLDTIDTVADDNKAATANNAKKVTLSTADLGTVTASNVVTKAGSVMSIGADATVKGFGVAGKAYDISGKNFRVLDADNYAATFNGTDRNYDIGTSIDARIKDYTVNSNAVAYKYNAKNGKFTVTTLLEAETDVNTFDKDNGDQIENDDLVYAFNYDGETKLVLIVDVMNK